MRRSCNFPVESHFITACLEITINYIVSNIIPASFLWLLLVLVDPHDTFPFQIRGQSSKLFEVSEMTFA